MPERRIRQPGGVGWVAVAGLWLVLLAGCRAPAAHIAATNPHCPLLSRSKQVACQLVVDSAVELAYHPLQHGRHLLTEPGEHLRAIADSIACKRLACLCGAPGPCNALGTLNPAALEHELERMTGRPLQPAHIQLYIDGQDALDALHALIDQATCSIDVLMFQWENDCVGRAVASWLAARAGPNLRVRVLVDGGGNLIFGQPEAGKHADVNAVVCELARQPYVELLRTRNPFGRFDHRKLVLVDGQAAWSGGRNLTRDSFFCQHDLSFVLTGPLTHELQECFDSFWREQGGAEPARGGGVAARLAQPANAAARLVCTSPTQLHLAQVVYRAVDRAQGYIYLENVYLSDCRLICKLCRARRRGVDVRVLLTLDAQSPVVNRANRVTANRLLRAGVRVYLYPSMTHVKAAVVDGCWAYLGTANYDNLSMRHNRELGVAIADGPIIGELEEGLFLPDLRPEWELCQPLPLQMGDYACELLANLCL
jgi:cardiolipin synthase